jgi:hypothetical protein
MLPPGRGRQKESEPLAGPEKVRLRTEKVRGRRDSIALVFQQTASFLYYLQSLTRIGIGGQSVGLPVHHYSERIGVTIKN